MVDVARVAGMQVGAFEDHGRVGAVPVSILDLDKHAFVFTQVGAREAVALEGAVAQLDEPVGVFDQPLGVKPHVVGHHVGGHADAVAPGAGLEILEGRLAAQLGGHSVIIDRVGAGLGLGVAVPLLDLAAGAAALPDADQPQTGEAETRQLFELFVGDLVKALDRPAVLDRQLVQPDIGALGHQHQLGHPVEVGAEALDLLQVARSETQNRRGPRPQAARLVLLGQEVQARKHPQEQLGQMAGQVGREMIANELQLTHQGIRHAPEGQAQQLGQGQVLAA
ncbi:MAG: hypothetical protein BWY87_01237 [Deltaproteobacteria bacterium ADurb.Bin510]|nr:MAG: hypothetical protein BWY87_01237 [Deltaproteobacteria bacterium ADurb.Bin510]